jgi:NDP-sugar pyrophosphorylase family protein
MKELIVLIPMAGAGKRFANAGYTDPKPMIPVCGTPMIQWVISNFENIPDRIVKFIFVCQEEHLKKYDLMQKFSDIVKNEFIVVSISELTAGSLCTCLKVRQYINNDENLIIANSDQILNWSSDNFIKLVDETRCDGAIITSYSDSPKWSYCRIDYNTGWIKEVKEKEIISNIANTGIFFFSKGSDFVESADDCIHREMKVNGEYYTSIVFNYLINSKGQKILNYPISNNAFHPTGTPEDLEKFEKYYI